MIVDNVSRISGTRMITVTYFVVSHYAGGESDDCSSLRAEVTLASVLSLCFVCGRRQWD